MCYSWLAKTYSGMQSQSMVVVSKLLCLSRSVFVMPRKSWERLEQSGSRLSYEGVVFITVDMWLQATPYARWSARTVALVRRHVQYPAHTVLREVISREVAVHVIHTEKKAIFDRFKTNGRADGIKTNVFLWGSTWFLSDLNELAVITPTSLQLLCFREALSFHTLLTPQYTRY